MPYICRAGSGFACGGGTGDPSEVKVRARGREPPLLAAAVARALLCLVGLVVSTSPQAVPRRSPPALLPLSLPLALRPPVLGLRHTRRIAASHVAKAGRQPSIDES